MCGIFGHIGKGESSGEKCLQGLKFLEYRGYDSAGLAGMHGRDLLCVKEKGKISALEELIGSKIRHFSNSIGHTRWATHGEASQQNAHPHLDQKREVAVVHNGILENHHALRTMLEKEGVAFSSDTDSEVIAQLISFFYDSDILAAVRKALNLMEGFWALAILHKSHPDTIIATRFENPLVVGVSPENHESFVSSDPYAFSEKDLDLYFLKNHEIASVSGGSIEIYNENQQAIEIIPEHFDLPSLEVCKGEFEHFMLKEIFEQPLSVQKSIHGRFVLEEGIADLQEIDNLDVEQVLILGCGSSWHAGCLAAQMIEEMTQLPTRAEIASEFRYKQAATGENTLVIALSQSGETFDTIAAIKKIQAQGAPILAICNVPESSLMRLADYRIPLRAGPEISVCSTKAFTCQLSVLSLLALQLARKRGMTKKEGVQFLEELACLPKVIEAVLDQSGNIEALAKKYSSFSHFFFIGRQYMYPTCLEAALKLKEISYLNAFGYPAGELKHGPIALIDDQAVVIGLCGSVLTYSKMLSNLAEIKARNGNVIAFAPLSSPDIEQVSDHVLYFPHLCDALASIPYSVATQLFAYYMAKNKGRDIDKPRNLAKSVTVE